MMSSFSNFFSLSSHICAIHRFIWIKSMLRNHSISSFAWPFIFILQTYCQQIRSFMKTIYHKNSSYAFDMMRSTTSIWISSATFVTQFCDFLKIFFFWFALVQTSHKCDSVFVSSYKSSLTILRFFDTLSRLKFSIWSRHQCQVALKILLSLMTGMTLFLFTEFLIIKVWR